MAADASRLRVLLAEDDPVSREFLAGALRACGADATTCVDGTSALARARAEHWDLLMFDHHLPGLRGDEVLAALRQDPVAASQSAPAIATSAEAATFRALLEQAGFAEVVSKPVSLAQLRATLRRYGGNDTAPLDDASALRACGSADALMRLRRLFVDMELPRVRSELARTRADLQAFRPTLHRLRAACGFCGARALAEASSSLHVALATHADALPTQAAVAEFRRALEATARALGAAATPLQPRATRTRR